MKHEIDKIRLDYTLGNLDKSSVDDNPVKQFEKWLNEAIDQNVIEPTAMVLSTVDNNKPRSRVVLLKNILEQEFVFFTNYESAKGNEIKQNENAALNFFWPQLERQVRIEGYVKKLKFEMSEAYFNSRPPESRISAIVSPQSKEIESREVLENKVKTIEKSDVKIPKYWGGYSVTPNYVEFWQGRQNRLHDRIVYVKSNSAWNIKRLAP